MGDFIDPEIQDDPTNDDINGGGGDDPGGTGGGGDVQGNIADLDQTLKGLNSPEGLQESLKNAGTTFDIEDMNSTIDDVEAGKTTPSTERLLNKLENVSENFKEYAEKIQEENGEAGKDVENSPETKKTFIQKLGWEGAAMLITILGLGIAFGISKGTKIAVNQCYQVSTCGNSNIMQTIPCGPDTCSCDNISQCGNYTPCKDPNTCMLYFYQTLNAKTIIAALPALINSTYEAPVYPPSNNLQKIIIFAGILIVALVVLFMVYKLTNKK
jgi:hypothetical protein